jgi:hypothetical protein
MEKSIGGKARSVLLFSLRSRVGPVPDLNSKLSPCTTVSLEDIMAVIQGCIVQ